MLAHAKKLNIKKTVTTITLEHDKFANSRDNMLQIKALYSLLGGYNEVGRNINVDTHVEFQEKFNELINSYKHLL